MQLILFYYVACVGTTVHANKFFLPETDAPPGAVNTVLFIEKGHRCIIKMLLILFPYIVCVGTTIHVNKFPLLDTGASPGAVNPELFIENRQRWSEKGHRCNLQMLLILVLYIVLYV
jgi:hypothetical protein